MIIVGEYVSYGEEHILVQSVTKTKHTYILYKKQPTKDMPEIALANIMRPTEDNIPYISGYYVLTKAGKGSQYYGNFHGITEILMEMRTVINDTTDSIYKEVVEDSLTQQRVVQFENGTNSYREIHYGNSGRKAIIIPTLELKDFYTMENHREFKELKETIDGVKYKRLDQLMQEKDLSWCMEPDGTLTKDYKIVSSLTLLKEMVKEMMQVKYIALDTETTGLDFNSLPAGHPKKSQIVGMSLTWKLDQGIYLPFRHTQIENIPMQEAIELLMPILTQKHLITHNGTFDAKVMWDEFKVHLNIMEDTQLLAFHNNPTVAKGNTALKPLTLANYNHETIELDDIFGSKDKAGAFRHLPYDLTRIYACADTDYTYRLMFDLVKRLTPQQRVLYANDTELIRNIYRDEYYGNKLDEDLLNKLYRGYTKDLETMEKLMRMYVEQIGTLTLTAYLAQQDGKSEEEIQAILTPIKEDPEFHKKEYREMDISTKAGLEKVVFDYLRYPVVRWTNTGKPSVDQFARKDYLRQKTNRPNNWLKKDVPSALVEENIPDLDKSDLTLIEAKSLSNAAFPFIVLFEKYKEIEGLIIKFFNGLIENQTDGWYFTGYRLTNAETARVINPIQTLKGPLKKLVGPYTSDYYMMVFDFAAIEYRVMAAISGNSELIEKLDDPETDYHREVGAGMMGTTPEDMTKAERNDIKAVNFAVPYGMGQYSLGQNLARQRKEAFTQRHVDEAFDLLQRWKKANFQLYSALEEYRNTALTKGVVENAWGRKKYFDISELDGKKRGSISRQSGNYPIQSLARDIFIYAYNRLKRRIEKEGFNKIKEDGYPMVSMPNLVHDEIVSIVHKSIHPYKMYEMILEECMLKIEGHPTYFAGINIVDNWYEGKDDKFEAPIRFVWEKVEEYKANPSHFDNLAQDFTWSRKLNVLDDIEKYLYKRMQQYLRQLAPNLKDDLTLNLKDIMPRLKDYFLKPRLPAIVKPKRNFDKGDDEIYACLESLALDLYEQIKVIYPDGTEATLTRPEEAEVAESTLDLFSLLDDDYNEREERAQEIYEGYEYVSDSNLTFDIPVFPEVGEKAQATATTTKAKPKIIKQLFDVGESAIMIDYTDCIVFDVSSLTKTEVDGLLNYLLTCQHPKGNTLAIKLHSNRKEYPNVKIGDFDSDEVSRLTNGKLKAMTKLF